MARKKKKQKRKDEKVKSNPGIDQPNLKPFTEYSPDDVQEALTKYGQYSDPISLMIFNAQAAFDIARHSEYEVSFKNVFHQLEQVHHFCRALIWKRKSS